MNGLYELLASATIGLAILGANWWLVYIDRPRKLRLKTNSREAELQLLKSELRYRA